MTIREARKTMITKLSEGLPTNRAFALQAAAFWIDAKRIPLGHGIMLVIEETPKNNQFLPVVRNVLHHIDPPNYLEDFFEDVCHALKEFPRELPPGDTEAEWLTIIANRIIDKYRDNDKVV